MKAREVAKKLDISLSTLYNRYGDCIIKGEIREDQYILIREKLEHKKKGKPYIKEILEKIERRLSKIEFFLGKGEKHMKIQKSAITVEFGLKEFEVVGKSLEKTLEVCLTPAGENFLTTEEIELLQGIVKELRK